MTVVNSEVKSVAKDAGPNESARKRALAASFVLISAFLYFATYDMPGSLVKVIEHEFKIQTYQFEYLYTFYGVPSVFVCLFGGLLIDRIFGLYRGLICFVLVSLVGQTLLTIGAFLHMFWLMVVGRFVYGMGTESLIIALNCVIVLWFNGKEISFVFGMFQSFIRLGTTFAFGIAVPLYIKIENSGYVPKKYVFGVTLLPFLFLVVVQLVNVSILSRYTYTNFKGQTDSKTKKHDVQLTYIIHLPAKYWILIAMFCISTSTVYAFVSCSQEFFENKYKVPLEEANRFSTFFNLFTSLSIPLIGLMMNQVGYDLTVNLIGTMLGMLGQLLLTVTSMSPYLPLIIYSISITIINICTMPMVPLVVKDSQVATAYGVLQSIINGASALFQILAGYILEKAGPPVVSMFFSMCLTFGLICTIILLILNRRDNGVLNLSAKHKKAHICDT